MPKRAGRPTKITDVVINQMKNYIMAGISLKDACELVGIGATTWREFERREPNFRRKRKQWQGMLKAQAKLNLADHIYGNKKKGIKPSVGWSQYLLDSLSDQEYKNAQNAVSRAQARKINAEVEKLKAEIAAMNGETRNGDSTTLIDDIGGADHDDN